MDLPLLRFRRLETHMYFLYFHTCSFFIARAASRFCAAGDNFFAWGFDNVPPFIMLSSAMWSPLLCLHYFCGSFFALSLSCVFTFLLVPFFGRQVFLMPAQAFPVGGLCLPRKCTRSRSAQG